MKTIHKVVLALVSSFANGTSNPAPQGNRALEKMDALTHGHSPSPKQENRNPETPQKRSLLQKVKEAWMNPKETAATIGVGITYGIVIASLLLLPFPPKGVQAQSTPQPLPRPKTPEILEVHVDGLYVQTPGKFDISVVTDGAPAWTYYKWCWSGVYYSERSGRAYEIHVLDPRNHPDYVSYVNYWNEEYYWDTRIERSKYNCTIVSHGDNRHVADVGLEVWANLEFYVMGPMPDGTYRPLAYVTDSDGTSDYVPVNWNGTWFPGW